MTFKIRSAITVKLLSMKLSLRWERGTRGYKASVPHPARVPAQLLWGQGGSAAFLAWSRIRIHAFACPARR
jgi:hypothetical protein